MAQHTTHCKFEPGQLVHHKRYDYRGVIFDVDESCQAENDWYQHNKTQPDRDQPWYHVLVDGSTQTTYVAEENLEQDESQAPINHPLVNQYFNDFADGRYHRQFDA